MIFLLGYFFNFLAFTLSGQHLKTIGYDPTTDRYFITDF